MCGPLHSKLTRLSAQYGTQMFIWRVICCWCWINMSASVDWTKNDLSSPGNPSRLFQMFHFSKTVAARWMWPCGQGPGSRRGASQLITDFFFDNGSGWLRHSHSSLTPRSVQDWWIAQKVAQQIKKQSRGSAFTASCRCPWYKEPHCNSEHTCSLVTQHTHTLACTRADAVHLLERSESKNKLKQWTMEGWRATTSASSRGTHHVFDWDVYDGREKWMLCFDFQQIGTEPLAQRAPVKTRHFSTEWQWRAEWILLGCKQMYVSNKQSPHLDIW